jgi:DNA-directed RNA polymerase specialized sigma24 family protein
MSARDAEYTEYVAARLSSLRRLAAVLCDDWQRADDLVQATLTKLYVHWGRAREASHADAYARTVLVHEFIHERRSSWARRVSLRGGQHPVLGATELFARHLLLLGPRPARWAREPIGRPVRLSRG